VSAPCAVLRWFSLALCVGMHAMQHTFVEALSCSPRSQPCGTLCSLHMVPCGACALLLTTLCSYALRSVLLCISGSGLALTINGCAAGQGYALLEVC
jgi:hypothetical protein